MSSEPYDLLDPLKKTEVNDPLKYLLKKLTPNDRLKELTPNDLLKELTDLLKNLDSYRDFCFEEDLEEVFSKIEQYLENIKASKFNINSSLGKEFSRKQETLLHLIVKHDDVGRLLPIFLEIFKSNVNLDVTNKRGNTPLQSLVIRSKSNTFSERALGRLAKHENAIELLLRFRNNSINRWNNSYKTPLYSAIVNTNFSIVRELLLAGANINGPQNSHLDSALGVANRFWDESSLIYPEVNNMHTAENVYALLLLFGANDDPSYENLSVLFYKSKVIARAKKFKGIAIERTVFEKIRDSISVKNFHKWLFQLELPSSKQSPIPSLFFHCTKVIKNNKISTKILPKVLQDEIEEHGRVIEFFKKRQTRIDKCGHEPKESRDIAGSSSEDDWWCEERPFVLEL